MPEWVLRADVLVPEYLKTLQYSGLRPVVLLKIMPELMKDIFRQESPQLYEDSLKWDTSAEPADFYGSWRIRDKKDARTAIWGIVTLQGKQAKDGSGSVTVWIRGDLITTFPYSTPLDRGLAWLYIYLFYGERKKKYFVEARNRLEALENEIRKQFDLIERAGRK